MKILTTKDVQELLNISENAVYRLYKKPGCPHFKVGGTYRIIEDDLIAWLKTKENRE